MSPTTSPIRIRNPWLANGEALETIVFGEYGRRQQELSQAIPDRFYHIPRDEATGKIVLKDCTQEVLTDEEYEEESAEVVVL